MADEAQLTAAEFVKQLLNQRLFSDAVTFWAHALPKRHAAWWAAQAARAVRTEDIPDAESAALAAAETWICTPRNEQRLAAKRAAEAASLRSPGTWAAMAAYWSGCSLAPENTTPVPPGDGDSANAVIASIRLAALNDQPAGAPDRFRLFLSMGINIGEQLEPWNPRAEQIQEPYPPIWNQRENCQPCCPLPG
jgi:hypothetical protein